MRALASKDDGSDASDVHRTHSRLAHSPRHESLAGAAKSSDKLSKRASPAEDSDRLSKRRKGDAEVRDLDGEARYPEKERPMDPRLLDLDRTGAEDRGSHRVMDKNFDRSKDKGDRYDKDHRDRFDHPEKSRGDDIIADRSRDRSMERYGRERSVDRVLERGSDRNSDRLADKTKEERNKDDRSRMRYSESSSDKSHADDRFHGQSLPPPPPLPPHVVPQSVNAGRKDDDADRRFGTTRHGQRLSPRHEEKERRRSEEGHLMSLDDAKRRREDEFRERKRDEREGPSMKVRSIFLYVYSFYSNLISYQDLGNKNLFLP